MRYRLRRNEIRISGGAFSRKQGGAAENLLLLQEEGVRGPLRHRLQVHGHQQASVKREAISRKKDSFMVLRRSITRYTVPPTLT